MSNAAELPDFAATVESVLGSLSVDSRRTLEADPRATVEPSTLVMGTQPPAALSLLESFAREHPSGTLPRLELEETLAVGGMGIVRLATQHSVGRKVAVKSVRPDVASDAAVLKLLREAWVTGALEHPNVVPVYDVAVDGNGSPLILLRRIEGQEWAELLRDPDAVRARFGVANAREWHLRTLMQVSSAVHFAHSRGIVHRDLKPENVMIGEFGEVYVVDWGIALSLRADAEGRFPTAKQSFGVAGTPCYMAPEMLAAEPTGVSVRTDVYLLGALLYEIVTGRPPHVGPDLSAIFRSVLLSPPEVPDSVPAELAHICRRAMARSPEDRFQSAEELRLALQQFLAHESSVRLSEGAERALVSLLEGATNTSGGEERRRELYDRLSECRFGFRAALEAWPRNGPARRGLERALHAMIDYELKRGDARAAAPLLSELTDPPEAIRRRVDAAIARQGAEERRLRKLAANLDPNVGRRTRLVVGAGLGAFWTLAPIVAHVTTDGGRTYSHEDAIALGTAILIVGAIVAYVARRALLATSINRRLVASFGAVMVIELGTDIWGRLAARSPAAVLELDAFLFFVMASSLAIHISSALTPAALGYAVVFVVASLHPQSAWLAIAAGNLLLTANAVWLWRKPLSEQLGEGRPSALPPESSARPPT